MGEIGSSEDGTGNSPSIQNNVKFSIITPSFRSIEWLRLCIPSVADQGVELEHIVQDSCSDDGTPELIRHDPRVRAVVEKDKGMYDAVNKGWQKASGEILAYINCDEQYLPGALKSVEDFFIRHPEIDIVFGDVVIVNADGAFNCFRKVQVPWKYHTWVGSNLCTFTAATFLRRSVIEKHQLFFDTRYRDVGDCEWMLRAINKGLRMGLIGGFTSTFTETGVNMNLLPNAQREKAEFLASAPAWARSLAPVFRAIHRIRRLQGGAYSNPPFDYHIHTKASPLQRQVFHVANPSARWIR